MAKKYRSEMERARDFYKHPKKDGDRAQAADRIAKLKQRLPCARCGRLGHWKDDKECPRNQAGNQANMVSSSDGAHTVHIAETGARARLLLVDTACAKTVAGQEWADRVITYYKNNLKFDIPRVRESEPFRFGPGPLIRSTYALLLPVVWHGKIAVIRFSIVNRDVPPLVAKRVL
eukprot:8600284-Alexandrium_andersonii.AAC.1